MKDLIYRTVSTDNYQLPRNEMIVTERTEIRRCNILRAVQNFLQKILKKLKTLYLYQIQTHKYKYLF